MPIHTVKLKPFPTPAGVYVDRKPDPRQIGATSAPLIRLDELTPEALDELCRDFHAAVFEKAGYKYIGHTRTLSDRTDD